MARLEEQLDSIMPTRLLIEESGLITNTASAEIVREFITPKELRFKSALQDAQENPLSKAGIFFADQIRLVVAHNRLDYMDTDFENLGGEIDPPSLHTITLDLINATFYRSLLNDVSREMDPLAVQRMIILAEGKGPIAEAELKRLAKVATCFDHAFSASMLIGLAQYAEDPEVLGEVLRSQIRNKEHNLNSTVKVKDIGNVLELIAKNKIIGLSKEVEVIGSYLRKVPLLRDNSLRINGIANPLEVPFIDAIDFMEDSYTEAYPLAQRQLSVNSTV